MLQQWKHDLLPVLLLKLTEKTELHGSLSTSKDFIWLHKGQFSETTFSCILEKIVTNPIVLCIWFSICFQKYKKFQLNTQAHSSVIHNNQGEKWSKCLSTDKWISRACCVHVVGFYKGRKLWHMLQHGWLLQTWYYRQEIRQSQKINTAWFNYENLEWSQS
jgi:hypothetical protein